MMDPHYRTIEGFISIIHKEWYAALLVSHCGRNDSVGFSRCSFGHKFEDRIGKCNHKETSPIFLQFLDCVYQVRTSIFSFLLTIIDQY